MAKNIRFVGFPEIKKVEKAQDHILSKEELNDMDLPSNRIEEEDSVTSKINRLRERGWSEDKINRYMQEVHGVKITPKITDSVEKITTDILRQKLLRYDIKLEDVQDAYSVEIAALDTLQDIAELVKLIAYNLGKI